MQNEWAYNECFHAPSWDARCRTTLQRTCEQLAEHAQVSFSCALGRWRKAVSHLLHHQDTSAADLLDGHVKDTSVRCQAHDRVLIVSDTTVYDFTTHKAVTGLEPVGAICLLTNPLPAELRDKIRPQSNATRSVQPPDSPVSCGDHHIISLFQNWP